ncbi:lysis protein [Yersinia nurmii]|uniref:Lysis protein n=1 Tax=Yersinia nurmii TaxID=685706 RepID=A0AAW7K661_9GAMM|nr:lysis protein [Yersinia nurmii]MDN0086010.1 lysis protein [Yersinia nurmii]
MSEKLIAFLTASLIVCLFGLMYYHRTLDELRGDVADLIQLAYLQKQQLQRMDNQRQGVAALDVKHTRELADAKSKINHLRDSLADGNRRLQIHASCKRLPNSASATSVDDVARPGLTHAAERGYLRLRERIAMAGRQIAGLQEYIKNVCQPRMAANAENKEVFN